MKHAIFSLLSLLFATVGALYGQVASDVQVKFEPGLETIISNHFLTAKEEKNGGYRVLLTSESGNGSRDVANAVKASFIKLYPEYQAYLDWDSPNYKVKVGDFKTRLDATLFWKQINIIFTGSYVVQDNNINPIKFK